MIRRLLVTLFFFSASLAWSGEGFRNVTLDIKGMDCASCPLTVRQALKKTPGVADVKVDYASKTAEIRFEADKTSPAQLAKVVTDIGYPSTARKTAP